MVFRRQGTYAIVAILVALVVAALLFAGSAWSQDKNGDSTKDRKETRQEKRTQNRETRTENNRATQDPPREQQVGAQQVSPLAEASANDITLSKIDDPDPVEVDGLLLYTIEVTNDDTAASPRTVVIRNELPDSVELLAVDISGGINDEGVCEPSNDEEEVFCEVRLDGANNTDDTATIQILVEPQQVGEIENFAEVFEDNCGDMSDPNCPNVNLVDVEEPTRVVNDRNRDNRDNRDNRRERRDQFRDRFPPPFFDDRNDFVDEDDDGIPDVFDEDIEEDEDDIDEDEDNEDIDEDEDGNVDSSINSTADDDCIETETDTDTNTNTDNETNSDTLEDSSTLNEDLSDEDTLDTNDDETDNSETASLERIDFETVAFQTADNDETDDEFSEEDSFETEDTEDDETDSDTLDECEDDPGVSANADDGQAEASTPGATARSGGDPDEQEPLTTTPDDVVDEIPTTGELPNTGGIPLAAGTMVALILFGAGLLAVRLVMIWHGRRA